MKDKLVGHYQTGNHNCRLIITAGTGASFNLCPGKKSTAEIKIGGEEKKFQYIIESLVHEIVEFTMAEKQVRFDHADGLCWTGDRYYFFMNHRQFAEVATISGTFIESCYADLKKAWLEFKRKPKKKLKRRKK